MSQGKFFLLVSKLGGHSLGPEGGSSAAGARLLTVPKYDNDDRQYWYSDAVTGTVRNKANGFCITIGGDCNITLQPYQANNPAQQFAIQGDTVQNKDGRVLDITGENPNVGVPLCAYKAHGGKNQAWDRVFEKPKFFMLKGDQSGRVIDIEGANKAPGTKICLYDASGSVNQQWYEDGNGLIRSKLNDFVFDGSGKEVTMQPYEPNNAHRAWALNGPHISQVANPKIVLDVIGQNTANTTKICAYNNTGNANQKFTVQFV